MTSTLSRLGGQAGPAFRRLVQAVRVHGPPALRRARSRLGALASRGFARTRDFLQRALDQRRSRAARPAHPAAPRASREAWLAQLDALGRDQVEEMLERTSSPHAGPFDVVPLVDAGITHGANRYPTRQFIIDWLGNDQEPADLRLWRASAITVTIVAAVSMGMVAFLI